MNIKTILKIFQGRKLFKLTKSKSLQKIKGKNFLLPKVFIDSVKPRFLSDTKHIHFDYLQHHHIYKNDIIINPATYKYYVGTQLGIVVSYVQEGFLQSI